MIQNLSLIILFPFRACNAQAEDTIRFVDVETIKKGSVIPNIEDKAMPWKPIILQPRQAKQSRSSTKPYGICGRRDDPGVANQREQQQPQLKSSGCAQCKIYIEKLKLTEKKCQKLEEFIRKNLKSVSENDNNSTVSMLMIEKCSPTEVSTNQHFNGMEEILPDNDDASNLNDGGYL